MDTAPHTPPHTDADAGPSRPYHHGNLRAALLQAAELELAERGIEGFSLRQVARRAGVSHAAPAHHFGDADGLLTALAAEGFRRFLATQVAREAVAPPDPRSQLTAAGQGYIDFARASPAVFRLIFGSRRLDYDDPDLQDAADAAMGHLMTLVAATGGGADDAAGVWAMVHGLADLMMAGRLKWIDNLPPPARDATVARLVARSLPTSSGPDGPTGGSGFPMP